MQKIITWYLLENLCCTVYFTSKHDTNSILKAIYYSFVCLELDKIPLSSFAIQSLFLHLKHTFEIVTVCNVKGAFSGDKN